MDHPKPASAEPATTESPSLERMERELIHAQRQAVIGALAPGLAHDLNNPLAAILAFGQLIRGDPRLPADLRHDAEVLVEEAEKTRRIVNGLLDFARRRPPERHPTRLSTLVASVLSLLAYPIATSHVDVTVEIDEGISPVAIDRPSMQQVLATLTLNAIEAIGLRGGGGQVAIRGSEDPSAAPPIVRLSIVDDGPGVATSIREGLFAPFITTKDTDGAGLGLFVARRIVESHGGRLRYEPGPRKIGAAFVIELPTTAGPTPAARPRQRRG